MSDVKRLLVCVLGMRQQQLGRCNVHVQKIAQQQLNRCDVYGLAKPHQRIAVLSMYSSWYSNSWIAVYL